MRRMINLFTSTARVHMPNMNMNNVDISNLNSVINYSVDTIFGYIFEYISSNDFNKILPLILEKLRVGGDLVIRFHNFKKICDEYAKNQVSDIELLSMLQNKVNILSIDRISSSIDSKFVISKIDYIDYHIVIIVQRKEL